MNMLKVLGIVSKDDVLVVLNNQPIPSLIISGHYSLCGLLLLDNYSVKY